MMSARSSAINFTRAPTRLDPRTLRFLRGKICLTTFCQPRTFAGPRHTLWAGPPSTKEISMSNQIVDQVRDKYASLADSAMSSDHAGVRAVAEAFGYSPEELASIPAEANMGLSCGNPTAFARLRAGETVVDLGCGGGLDVLLAAPKVGSAGTGIGIHVESAKRARARWSARQHWGP